MASDPLATLAGMGQQEAAAPDQQSADDQGQALSRDPHYREWQRVMPLLQSKVSNFMGAIAGSPPPNEYTGLQARGMLESALGLDLGQVADQYVNYKQSNPIHRQLTDLMVHGAVNSNADRYVNDVLNRKLPYFEGLVRQDPGRSAQSESIASYQRAVLAGLRNLLQDKDARGAVMKHLMDFRTLEQPIPFVQSKVSYSGDK